MGAQGFLTELVRAIGKGLVDIEGSFVPNGSSAIDNTKNTGKGFTVAYTSTGLYTITFVREFPALQSFVTGLQMATPADWTLITGPYSQANKTIQIASFSGGSQTDVAAATGNVIHFKARFKATLAPG